ncbi:galactose oxidase [Paramuricea clavata]|uniref:Galactose oxidase n=1 Tax=Paramuricea clavata TaxID=317549 RepID=A0A6S7GNC2_PARCT|nr:galactose oxidase [Paramuricea clavata]
MFFRCGRRHLHSWRRAEEGLEVREEQIRKSTECFNWIDQTWTSAVFEGRSHTSSFLYQGQMVIAGGLVDYKNKTNTLKCINVRDAAATWKDSDCKLPIRFSSHTVVNHNDLLFLAGGYCQLIEKEILKQSDTIYEVQLAPPYSSKILTRLPQEISYHGMEMFDQKLFILGGFGLEIKASVVQYDLIKNECKERPPLPYAVDEMATVLWRNNVLVIGDESTRSKCLNAVIMYDVITGRSQMLPCMKHKRRVCTAVLTGNRNE